VNHLSEHCVYYEKPIPEFMADSNTFQTAFKAHLNSVKIY